MSQTPPVNGYLQRDTFSGQAVVGGSAARQGDTTDDAYRSTEHAHR